MPPSFSVKVLDRKRLGVFERGVKAQQAAWPG